MITKVTLSPVPVVTMVTSTTSPDSLFTETVTLPASSVVKTTLESGGREFRSSVVVDPPAPLSTTIYTVRVQCSTDATCESATSMPVTVFPDVVPNDLGNTLRAIRSTLNVDLSWVSVVNARTYSLYRGVTKGVWPPPLLPGLTATTETLPDVAGPPNLYFYRVAGASCSGMEGP